MNRFPYISATLAIISLTFATVGFSDSKGTIVLPADADDVTLNWPVVSGFVLNSPFGPRQLGSAGARYDWHRGTDLKIPIGTDIVAPADAYVVFSGDHPGYADEVIQLRHNSNPPYLYTLYLHMGNTSIVTAGDTVAAGTKIGESGQGSASYPHLHWEVRRGCLNQVCCENVYGYLAPGTIPPTASVAAAGDSTSRGRMLLLEFEFPEDELDFDGVKIEWGGETYTADLDLLNSLTPSGTGGPGKLDDPLFFAEKEDRNFVFFPKRFNESYDSLDYQFLVWGLPPLDSGVATVLDASGQETGATVNVDLPPISVAPNGESLQVRPAAGFSIDYLVTNNDTISRTLDFEAIDVQSLSLSLSATSVTLDPGESTTITIESELSSSFPEDVGTVVLLLTTVRGGSWTPLLATTGVDSSNTARLESWTLLGK